VANNQRNQEEHKEKTTKWKRRSMKSHKEDKEDEKNLFVTEFLTLSTNVRHFFYLFLFKGTTARIGPWPPDIPAPLLVSSILLYSQQRGVPPDIFPS
jgi:hypothetical protein